VAHATQAAPPVPHIPFAVPASQVVVLQQPLGHKLMSQAATH
jgi:hypothetical protein